MSLTLYRLAQGVSYGASGVSLTTPRSEVTDETKSEVKCGKIGSGPGLSEPMSQSKALGEGKGNADGLCLSSQHWGQGGHTQSSLSLGGQPD